MTQIGFSQHSISLLVTCMTGSFFVQYNMHAPTEKEMEATRNIEWQDFEKNPEKYRHEFSVLGVNLEDYVISSPSEMTPINFEDYIIKWVD